MPVDATGRGREIACQQILLQDASVFSVQWLVVPERYAHLVSAQLMLERYLKLVRACTLSLVRPVANPEGVQFRLCWSSLAFLSFAPPRFIAGRGTESVHLRINGGLLVQAGDCGRGRFSFSLKRQKDGLRITVQLSRYRPLLLGSGSPSPLRRLLFSMTQAYLHQAMTVRYLSGWHRELTGGKLRVRLKQVRARQGRAI